MRRLVTFAVAILAVQQCVAPPVTKNKSETGEEKKEEGAANSDMTDDYVSLRYHRYLTEVLKVLEDDDEFRAKLQNASEEDIKSGRIAKELDFLNHGLRTKLDEIKREEMDRLRRLATEQYLKQRGLDPDHMKIHAHLDHENPETFEVSDLEKLILKTTADLSEADRKRRQEFNEYEMQKKWEEEQKKKGMTEEEQKKYAEAIKVLEEQQKKHKPLHHPGSKQQYEEVWEKQDHLEDQKFNPRTFFSLHDVDGNHVWDADEVKALFVKELDKIYQQGGPETDLREREEEMERMREHVFKEADLNGDGLISFEEFMQRSKSADFEQDEPWAPINEQETYTEEDYANYVRLQREEMERRIANGISPSGYGSYDPGHQQQYAVPHQGLAPPMGQVHPSNHHPQFQGQIPVQPHMQGQVPQYQQYQGNQQVPQYQGQMPPQQYQHGGAYPQQYQQGQLPQQGQVAQGHVVQQGQVPYQGQVQQHQGQVPQHQGQVPQHQGQVPQHQGQVPQHQGQVPQHQGQVPQHQGQVPQHQGQVLQHQGQVPQHQGQVPQHQGQVPQHQGQVPQHQGQVPQHQGQVPQPQGQVPVQQEQHVPVQQANVHPSENEIPHKTGNVP